jgi:hypothetical protein
MMLRDNLARIIESSRSLPRVLDVGGSAAPLNTATHILDVLKLLEVEDVEKGLDGGHGAMPGLTGGLSGA